MPEIVGTFARVETGDEGSDGSLESGHSSGGDRAQVGLEFAEGHLDGVKVGRILRQIAKGASCGFDRFANSGDFVGAQIIHHHDIVSFQATKVIVLQVPCGTSSITLSPRGARP